MAKSRSATAAASAAAASAEKKRKRNEEDEEEEKEEEEEDKPIGKAKGDEDDDDEIAIIDADKKDEERDLQALRQQNGKDNPPAKAAKKRKKSSGGGSLPPFVLDVMQLNDADNRATNLAIDMHQQQPQQPQQPQQRTKLAGDDYFSHHSRRGAAASNRSLPPMSSAVFREQIKSMQLNKSNNNNNSGGGGMDVHRRQAHTLLQLYRRQYFASWQVDLWSGFNVLCYGFGSKKALLDEFSRKYLASSKSKSSKEEEEEEDEEDEDDNGKPVKTKRLLNAAPVVVVNGFMPSLTVRDILDAVAYEGFGLKEVSASNTMDYVNFLQSAAQQLLRQRAQKQTDKPKKKKSKSKKKPSRRRTRQDDDDDDDDDNDDDDDDDDQAKPSAAALAAAAATTMTGNFGEILTYVVIHNIDGPALVSRTAQTVLAHLAAVEGVRVVASVDHLRAAMLWGHVLLARLNFVCYDATTFSRYHDETLYASRLLEEESNVGIDGVRHVIASWTDNGRDIFRILLDHQLAQADSGNNSRKSNSNSKKNDAAAVSFEGFYNMCFDAFLVSNEVTLRAQIGEYRDHRLLDSRRGADGVEMFFVPFPKHILRQMQAILAGDEDNNNND